MNTETKEEVYTPHGRGRIVYRLPDGTVLVQYPHGGGNVYRPGQLFHPKKTHAETRRQRLCG